MTDHDHSIDDDPGAAARRAQRTLGAIIITVAVVCGAYRILVMHRAQHSSLVFIGLPTLAAFSLLRTRPETAIGTINKVIALLLCLSGIVFGEGLVCILFAAPIFFLVGSVVGYAISAINRRRRGKWTGVVALTVVPFTLEGAHPSLAFNREEAVSVRRIVAGTPAEVRAALTERPRFDRPLPRFFDLGFPVPREVSGAGLAVGDQRRVVFGHGRHHMGALVMRVAAVDSASVTFRAERDSSYITHWLAWESAVVRWTPSHDRTTRVTWTLRYRRRLDPAWYFAPIERYGVGLAAGYLIETLATPRAESGVRR